MQSTGIASELFHACCLFPRDNTLRLIYADALEDRSGPGDLDRAELIRVQCELAKMRQPRSPYEQFAVMQQRDLEKTDPTHDAICAFRDDERELFLRQRERELLAQSEQTHRWYGPLLDLMRVDSNWWSYLPWWHNGFADHLTLPLESWIGRQCNTCGGSGRDQRESTDGDCPLCEGLGRIEPYGPRIVAATPVVRVEFSDLDPFEIQNGPQKGHWFFSRRDVGETIWQPEWGGVFLVRKTREAVIGALSDSTIFWARKCAYMEVQ